MNTAQKLLAAITGTVEHPDADLVLSGQQCRSMATRYHAPHKMRGTPPKPTRRMSSVLAPRLFKGYRP